MLTRRTHHDHPTADTHVVKGAGLARGPALVVGTILAVAGLLLFLHAGDTPTGGFPDADARGEKLLGFESNGWTAFFTTTAGVVLLFAAAQHLLAKLLGLVVGLALAACVVLDLVDGPGVLGLAAANWAVDLGWAIAAVVLLLNVFAPRVKHEAPVAGHRRLDDDTTRVAISRPAATTTADHAGPRTQDDHVLAATPTGEPAHAPSHTDGHARHVAPAGSDRLERSDGPRDLHDHPSDAVRGTEPGAPRTSPAPGPTRIDQ